MKKKNFVLFDYDGTLGGVEVNGQFSRMVGAAYSDVVRQFKDFVYENLGYSHELTEKLQQELDIKLCTLHGFGDKTRFANSLVLTWEALAFTTSNYSLAAQKRSDVFVLGMSVFNAYPYKPVPGALELLKELRSDWNLAIVTKGEQQEQMRKVTETGIANLVDDIIVVSRKDERDWEMVLEKLKVYQRSRKYSWAVGDSVKADVNPPVRMGLNGIHIADDSQWEYELEEYVTPKLGRVLVTVNSIDEVLAIVNS